MICGVPSQHISDYKYWGPPITFFSAGLDVKQRSYISWDCPGWSAMYHCKLQNIPAVWLTVNRRICGSDGHVCPIASIISSQSMKAGSVTIICLCKPRCWQVCIITLIQICFPSSGRGPGSQLSVVAVWRVASTTHTFSRPRQWDVFASQFYICARLQFHHLRLGKGGIDWDWTLATWQDLLGLPANLFAIPTVQSYKIETNYFANFV